MSRAVAMTYGTVQHTALLESSLQDALQRIRSDIQWVDIDLLRRGPSPRLDGIDTTHVRHLAGLLEELPPLVVHQATMRVMDGLHRLAAARSRGERQVPVVYFEGSPDEAFVVAVRLNAIHGRALRRQDRAAAVRRILSTHSHCSDRSIAAMCGVAPRTVARLRQESTKDQQQLTTRIGRDGRRHPLTAQEGRRVAEQIMREEPAVSLREVARRAGVSVGTALDVRRQLLAASPTWAGQTGGGTPLAERQWAAGDAGRVPASRIRAQLEWLTREPALRYTDQGRALLRLVSTTLAFLDRSDPITEAVPDHCQRSLHAVARACASGWLDFAEQFNDEHVPSRAA